MYLPDIDDIRYQKSADGRTYTGFAYTEPGGNKKTGKAATRPVRFPKDMRITSLSEAKRQARAWLEANKVAEVVSEVPTIKEVIDAYAAARPAKRGPGSLYASNTLLIVDRWGHKLATEWGSELIYQVIDVMTAAKYSPTTIRMRIRTVQWAFGRAISRKMMPESYILPDDLDLPEANVRHNFLLPEDEQRLWDYAVSILRKEDAKRYEYDTALFVCIALETAGRAEAIQQLRWDNGQINFQTGMLDLNLPGRAITIKRRAAMFITERLWPVLRLAHARSKQKGALFPRKLSYHTFSAFVKRAKLSNPKCSRHDLRRTWATLKAMSGVDLYLICQILGDSLKVVEKHYAKFYHNDRVREQLNRRPSVGNVIPFPEVDVAGLGFADDLEDDSEQRAGRLRPGMQPGIGHRRLALTGSKR